MRDDQPTCPDCQMDPKPATFGEPRRCAFRNREFWFMRDNWRCGTLDKVAGLATRIVGQDQTIHILEADPDADRGWIVLARYKERGHVDSAIHVTEDSHLDLTLAVAARAIAYHESKAAQGEPEPAPREDGRLVLNGYGRLVLNGYGRRCYEAGAHAVADAIARGIVWGPHGRPALEPVDPRDPDPRD